MRTDTDAYLIDASTVQMLWTNEHANMQLDTYERIWAISTTHLPNMKTHSYTTTDACQMINVNLSMYNLHVTISMRIRTRITVWRTTQHVNKRTDVSMLTYEHVQQNNWQSHTCMHMLMTQSFAYIRVNMQMRIWKPVNTPYQRWSVYVSKVVNNKLTDESYDYT